MFGLGLWEIVVIVLIIVLLFGARKLPELGKGLGEGIRSFKDAIKGGEDPEAGKRNDSSRPDR